MFLNTCGLAYIYAETGHIELIYIYISQVTRSLNREDYTEFLAATLDKRVPKLRFRGGIAAYSIG